jgi:hypothetical protein
VFFGVLATVLFLAGRGVLRWAGIGNDAERTATVLTTEENGSVTVRIEGGESVRAETGLKMYPGETVTTGHSAHAVLSFFDGSTARLDEQSEVEIVESAKGTDASTLTVRVGTGRMWIRVPNAIAYSGSIVRTIETPSMTLTLPTSTELISEERAVSVFEADGVGVMVTLANTDTDVVIGEGQTLKLPEGEMSGDPYRYRSASDISATTMTFVKDSRTQEGKYTDSTISTSGGNASSSLGADELLVVTQPKNGITASGGTIVVAGTTASSVAKVRANSFEVVIDRRTNTFSQDLALPTGQDVDVVIQALDDRGVVVAEEHRTVHMTAEEMVGPNITTPAKNGETYQTPLTELEIRGTAAPGTDAIIVNDYRLQLFRPGDVTWSYLASTQLSNLREGENIYDIVAVDRSGRRSTPSRIIIVVGEGPAGVISTSSSSSTTSSAMSNSSASSEPEEAQLPQNDPLAPGSLSVTYPAPGTSRVSSGTGFLLQGTTSANTKSIWVNGYRLRLYTPRKTTWNYLADFALGTLHRGANTFHIVARDGEDRIIDKLDYDIAFDLVR